MRCPKNKGYQIFREMSERITDECVEWPYTKGGQMGYGQVWIAGKKEYVHRHSYLLRIGPISNGLHVLHRCDNPKCFNPKHLFLGTERDNRRDQYQKNRGMLGEKNPAHRLTTEQVLQIRREYIKGKLGYGEIATAKKFGVTAIAIRKIIRKQTWGWLC